MRKLAALSFVTLDGVMQSPGSPDEDRSNGFVRGGWAAPYWDSVMAQVRREAMAEPYDILFGRRTYELFAGHFSNQPSNDPEARMLNDARKYVASNTLEKANWQNTDVIAGNVLAQIAALKAREGPLIQIHGSSALVNPLTAEGLIDEYRIWVFPVVVGAGKRLFGDGSTTLALDLTETQPTGNGAVMAIYWRRH